ncbi:ADP-ribose pyrophosphatase YjhB (NUDIX family) [Anoxybacillus calidus]|jgi:8-oxo-dGTP diphosphatase|uniref:ADP-ribose pyrophosphatase YjhB (NUDIX family) n=1 Tax=[Anoxybacillus] calidus TaxID=575178 RepID=A0A7W0BU82_9BACL|nr:NUDIX domain-containing protein [Anoxybacillus calidus]MBA2870295.1 ADP-ribose pyrophosphatase YjhB (NUDIX family) [Anoxybacillus calidus]
MIYKRKTYRVLPEKVSEFTTFFDEYLLPNQLKNGAKLIGRWITETKDEIIELWEYPSYEEYLKIEERVRNDEMYQQAQSQLQKLGNLYLDNRQDFLESTGTYSFPKHTVTVSGYITNEQQETLLVKTYWRSDTWELPGGAVDEGETLDLALCREIFEETGISVKLLGVTGVYSNGSTVSVVFRGEYNGGNLKTSTETKDVRFLKIDSSNVMQYITRPKFRSRVLDAMKGHCIPYEAFKVRPYELLERLDGSFRA